MDRAYSLLNVKAIRETDDEWVIEGIASTPTADRMEDVVEPMGAKYALPMALLWHHKPDKPVGRVEFAKLTPRGIPYTARLPKVSEPGVLKDRIDEAVQSIKYRLVMAVSIGFRALKDGVERMKDGGFRFTKWEWLELSLVTIPANAEATITSIKSLDNELREAATGRRADSTSPGVTGTQSKPAESRFFVSLSKGQPVKTTQERLAELATAREQKAARMEEIMKKSGEEGRSTDEREAEEFDTLQTEVATIDADLKRLKSLETIAVAKANPVVQGTGRGEGAVDIPGSGPISVRRNQPKGTAFTRYAMALALSKGNLTQAERIAATYCKDTPEVGMVLKAATDAGSTTDTTWAAPLVQYQDMVSEFIELLRAETVLGRLNQVRRVPFNIRIPRQTAGTTGTFVGEGAPAPVRELAFDNITLPWAKASTIVVVTAELAKFSNPSAEALVRQDLLAGMAEYLDKRLLDPAYPGVANVSPASLTNGVTPTQASGSTLAALDANVRTLMTTFADANLGLGSGVWVMSASLAIRLSMMRTNQDSKAFPDLNVNGGTFYGLPVIVSNNVSPSGSPGDQHLILINQREVLLADEGQMMLDASAEASVQMNDAPSAGAQSLVSLWQNGLVGLKVDRWIYWTKRRSQAVQFIDKAQSYSS